jgi:octaprenyl-diphosphate synthase
VQNGEMRDGDLEQAIAYVKASGAVDETIQRARHFGAMACAALAAFPEGAEKSALLDAVEFCISRLH